MYGFILIFIGVFWCEIQLGLCEIENDLEFWVRDPKYDNPRRAVLETKANNTIRFGKVKYKHKIAKLTTKVINVTKSVTTEKITKANETAKQSLRTGKIDETWMRAKKRKHKRIAIAREPHTHHVHKLDDKDEEGTKKDHEKLNPYNLREQMEHCLQKSSATTANVSMEVIGRTAEYKDILLIKATEKEESSGRYFRADDDKYIDEVPEKKIIFIVHNLSVKGVHQVPCLSSVYEFCVLLDFYFYHLDKFDIFLIPLANPDGFIKAENVRKPFWDKNMSPQNACPGVALDRNFDVHWNTTSSSCSPIYAGPKPFSEAETRAVRDVFHHYSHKIVAYFHVHSGTYDYLTMKGDAVLYPKGYTDAQSDDDKYIDLKGEIDEAIKNATFQVLSVAVDTLHSWYGKVTGTSVDYAATVYGIPYAMEFVMQIYKADWTDEDLPWIALSEIWERLIDVIFNNIYKNSKNNDT